MCSVLGGITDCVSGVLVRDDLGGIYNMDFRVPVALRLAEIVAIETCLRDEELHPEGTDVYARRAWIDQIGAEILSTGEATVWLDVDQLYYLREVISIQIRSADDPQLGINLKRKIYTAIIEIRQLETYKQVASEVGHDIQIRRSAGEGADQGTD